MMNIYSLQFSVIFVCDLNALVFMGTSCFSCFICLVDTNILICYCMIYSFIRAFAGTYVDYYDGMAHRNRNFQYEILYKMQI